VLLLDEPTRGVDIGAKVDLYHAIVEAAAKGCAVLLATSEIEEALGLAHRILVLREGVIVDEQQATEASEESIIRAATGLLA
jgi:ABC-type sugar transport system ATPase subunit